MRNVIWVCQVYINYCLCHGPILSNSGLVQRLISGLIYHHQFRFWFSNRTYAYIEPTTNTEHLLSTLLRTTRDPDLGKWRTLEARGLRQSLTRDLACQRFGPMSAHESWCSALGLGTLSAAEPTELLSCATPRASSRGVEAFADSSKRYPITRWLGRQRINWLLLYRSAGQVNSVYMILC